MVSHGDSRIPKKYIYLDRTMLYGSKRCVRLEGELSRDFEVSSGVSQGDGISCVLSHFSGERGSSGHFRHNRPQIEKKSWL